mmetsp:Transcript_1078/g.1606  ORF Transcript_1078/g.1606 Transcript_1078/m.1606 type:complete len:393 (+) Transcript_1078:88-1266(+)|eukprot:CAMPEP_0197248402 /NCGR_PEP_ID=MMETSP1429-20130617/38690_1 /TAXON_ID=49237 /ORGANISM="Chaetoceros  sp., Strain UNC1202" /LENGTH=392 /DNA_ID=CAMNT_0042709607 /DNA_START=67 /DNA_END=1245 /DNA_ORIENTATION=-
MAPKEFIATRESEGIALVGNKPYYPNLTIQNTNDPDADSLISVALQILYHESSPPTDLAQNLKFKRITGGLTNVLYCISGFYPAQDYDAILIRVFGAEGMIDRDVETSTFASLAEYGVAPLYYGRFGNGRIEGWLDNHSPLSLADLQRRTTSEAIALQMAKLHKGFRVPETLAEWHDEEKPAMWSQMISWMDQAKAIQVGDYKTKEDGERGKKLLDLDQIEKELHWLKDSIIPKNSKVAFCHNDLLAGNIMQNQDTGEIKLIDFEYGGVNYVGFDIANHFNEYAGGTTEKDGKPDYSLFPDFDQQRAFVSCYVKTSRSLSTGDSNDVSEMSEEEEIENTLEEVKAYVLANHLYWGLWAVNQTVSEGTEEFDYLAYGYHRFSRYFESKDKLEK